MSNKPVSGLGRWLSPDECARHAEILYRHKWDTFARAIVNIDGKDVDFVQRSLDATYHRLSLASNGDVRYVQSLTMRGSRCVGIVSLIWGTDTIFSPHRLAEPFSWTDDCRVERYDAARHGAFYLMRGARQDGLASSLLPPALYPPGKLTVETFAASQNAKARAREWSRQQAETPDVQTAVDAKSDAAVEMYRAEKAKAAERQAEATKWLTPECEGVEGISAGSVGCSPARDAGPAPRA